MDINKTLESLISQSPFVAAGIYIAKIFIQKHESAINKLLETFESEVKSCEARYEMVFKELMEIKDKIK
ncbi:MAG: hypothetical protein K0Q50_705 [Vampirovibrio sp.]|jgi:hypothetical protein|nr:hypothetical protein [Vampirovibrio sp.]